MSYLNVTVTGGYLRSIFYLREFKMQIAFINV